MIFGIYKHYKGGWYLGLWKVWESTNRQPRREKVLYVSLNKLAKRKWKELFNVREVSEFFGEVYPDDRGFAFRFLKLGNLCYCRELDAYATCPKHGRPQYGNHMKLPRFDGKEHEK